MGLLNLKILSYRLDFLRPRVKLFFKYSFSIGRKNSRWKVLFFGADSFSVFSLEALTAEYRKGILEKLEVVTTIKNKINPVGRLAEKENLRLHKWPPDISFDDFDVGLVVSFGHLIPSKMIEKFRFGMINVHASLLPRWRGAAPIIHSIANGDTETGVTIMRIRPHKFDVGEILLQERVQIPTTMKMMELYSSLGELGARNLIKTLSSLEDYIRNAKPQPEFGVTLAPKVNSDFGSIKWNVMTAEQIFNLERAITGLYNLQTTWKGVLVKLMDVNVGGMSTGCGLGPGYVQYDKRQKCLQVLCSDLKFITVGTVSFAGKKIISATDFNNGYLKKEPPECRYFE